MGNRIPVAVAGALLLIGIAVAVTLARSPLKVIGYNAIAHEPEETLKTVYGRASVCQDQETLPAGTSAIRLPFIMDIGSDISVTASVGGHVLTRGHLPAGWKGAEVTIPLSPVPYTRSHVTICAKLGPSDEPTLLLGGRTSESTAALLDGVSLEGRFGTEYLKPDRRSWWSLAVPVARRMGLGRAWSGTGIGVLVVGLMLLSISLVCGLLLQRLR